MKILYYFAMKRYKTINFETKQNLENVSHETAARPFSIHHTFVDGDNTNALYVHCHPEAEFFCLAEGELSFFVEDQVFVLHGGDAILVPPNLTHHADKAPGMPCSYDALVFSLDWMSGYLGGEVYLYVNLLLKHRMDAISVFRKDKTEDAEMLERFSHFKAYLNRPIQSYEMRLLGELMISLQEIFNAVSDKMRYNDRVDAAREGVQRGIDYLMLHYDEGMTLAELVESSG